MRTRTRAPASGVRLVAALAAIAAALGGLGTGCLDLFGGDDVPVPGVAVPPSGLNDFSHARHAEREAGCLDCHPGARTEASAGLSEKLCAECHDTTREGDESDQNCAECHTDQQAWTVRFPVINASPDIKFSHAVHAKLEVQCDTCHGDVAKTETLSSANAPTMALCTECHEERGAPNDCATCHNQIRRDKAPATHDLAWGTRHGLVASMGSFAERDRCEACHAQQQCDTCHTTEAPRNHTNQWRLQGHGIAAAIDRSRCTTCHREDQCVRCHTQEPPRTHRGSWGSPINDHCLRCHVSSPGAVADSGCFACHKGTPSHDLAPSIIENVGGAHASGSTCLQCHTFGRLRVPHRFIGEGDACRVCHKLR